MVRLRYLAQPFEYVPTRLVVVPNGVRALGAGADAPARSSCPLPRSFGFAQDDSPLVRLRYLAQPFEHVPTRLVVVPNGVRTLGGGGRRAGQVELPLPRSFGSAQDDSPVVRLRYLAQPFEYVPTRLVVVPNGVRDLGSGGRRVDQV